MERMFVYRHEGLAFSEPTRSDNGKHVRLTRDQVAVIPWGELIVDSCSRSMICLRMNAVKEEFVTANLQVGFLDIYRPMKNRFYLRRNQALEIAVTMGLHPRLGGESPLRMLDDAILRSVLELITE